MADRDKLKRKTFDEFVQNSSQFIAAETARPSVSELFKESPSVNKRDDLHRGP